MPQVISDSLRIALRQRYPDVHPLIFLRSLEKATSPGEAFDILETLPNVYPVVWDDNSRHWVTTEDILQSKHEMDRIE